MIHIDDVLIFQEESESNSAPQETKKGQSKQRSFRIIKREERTFETIAHFSKMWYSIFIIVAYVAYPYGRSDYALHWFKGTFA